MCIRDRVSGRGSVIVVTKVENGIASYGVHAPGQSVEVNGKSYNSAMDAAAQAGAEAMVRAGAVGAMEEGAYKVPVEQLVGQNAAMFIA